MTKEELLSKIKPSKRPKHLRKGQYIFNWVDEHYQTKIHSEPNLYISIAREVQFVDKIDCFYDDSKLTNFLMLV